MDPAIDRQRHVLCRERVQPGKIDAIVDGADIDDAAWIGLRNGRNGSQVRRVVDVVCARIPILQCGIE